MRSFLQSSVGIASHTLCTFSPRISQRCNVPRRQYLTQRPLAVAVSADVPGPRAFGTLEADPEEAWQRLSLVQRQLKVAIADEDYALAAMLRDEQKTLSEGLPPVLQYALGQVAKLRCGSLQEQIQTINNLGEAGQSAVIPDLAACLAVPELQEAAERAMWALFMKAKDPRINELMVEGCSYLRSPASYDRALAAFDRMIQLQPSFAEGYNKRATVMYLLGRHEESMADCRLVLGMQPYHFGAASGLGLCLLQQSRYEEALAAFKEALAIHPGMASIRRFVEDLRKHVGSESSGDEGK